MPRPFFSGKNTTVQIFLKGTTVAVAACPQWSVKAEGVDVADGICGEDRDRLDFIINYFTVSLTFQLEGMDLLNQLIELQATRDANVAYDESAVNIVIATNDAKRHFYSCREYVVGAWDLGIGGRTERNKVTLPGRCRYFDQLPAHP